MRQSQHIAFFVISELVALAVHPFFNAGCLLIAALFESNQLSFQRRHNGMTVTLRIYGKHEFVAVNL